MRMDKQTLIKVLARYKVNRKIMAAVAKLPDRGTYGLNDILNQLKGV